MRDGQAGLLLLGLALRRTSARLDRLLRREREFTVNASHQLLSPITALGLQLEDLRAWPETPPSVAEELRVSLATLDRLAASVHGLLAQDRSTRRTDGLAVDLSDLTEQVVARWRPTAAEQGREIVLDSCGEIPAHLVAGEVTQVLDALLDHACRHGSGTVVVDCAVLGTHLRVRVGDEGRSSAESDVLHRAGSPRGADAPAGCTLEAAAELAEAQGGYLVRDGHPTTRFVLMLPRPSAV